ncbi:HpcH/HpaI aldolase family protein [Aspergillus fijiensis CBS 313.89]|uniref:Putative 4-hydroxy-2-oxovalerate aldolase n=1 Tax=Aspergillus fijiensis CBS 313.89 TaxID=1448319 RepID=A0A8G1RXE6_9EURO|nr:putative 4-hydroxy-2-oxovalerate aldolase [Aspergillus fijiensis CBS 313.89]RAK80803.1 putative 4-hydroxy-2-oxovalerate aldolase [Aspergillus fijiensis CBS 313.89]
MGSITPLPTDQPPHPYALSNPFRTRILAGEITPLMSIKLLTSNEIPMMCKMAGVHALFIDMEHSALDLHQVGQLILACNYAGVSAVVRSPSKSHWHISRILDAGASAVVVPHIETLDEVHALVKCAKYAPLGARGCTNNLPAFNFQHVPTLTQNEVLNRETMLIPMIETPAAVEIAEEILAFEGVDGVLVGSNDLCADLGIPGKYDSALYQDAVTKVLQAGRKAGKPVGIGGIGSRLDILEKWFRLGASWSLSGQDASMLQAGLRQMARNYAEIGERVAKST